MQHPADPISLCPSQLFRPEVAVTGIRIATTLALATEVTTTTTDVQQLRHPHHHSLLLLRRRRHHLLPLPQGDMERQPETATATATVSRAATEITTTTTTGEQQGLAEAKAKSLLPQSQLVTGLLLSNRTFAITLAHPQMLSRSNRIPQSSRVDLERRVLALDLVATGQQQHQVEETSEDLPLPALLVLGDNNHKQQLSRQATEYLKLTHWDPATIKVDPEQLQSRAPDMEFHKLMC